MPELTPKLGLPIPPGGDSSLVSRDLRDALLGIDAALATVEVLEIGPDVAGYVSGSLVISRVGATITLTMYGLTIDNGTATLYTLPERFRPVRTTYWGSGGGWLHSGQPRININANGAMSAASLPASQPLYNTITYIAPSRA